MLGSIALRLARCSLLSSSAAAVAVMATPAVAQQPEVRSFDIPAQPLSSALLEFSKQSDVMVVVAPALTAGKRAPALKGAMPVSEAIARLLRGSRLHASLNSAGGYIVSAEGNASHTIADSPLSTGEGVAGSAAAGNGSADTKEIIVTAQKRSERLIAIPVPVTALPTSALVQSNQLRLQDYYTRVPGLSLTTADPNAIGIPVIAVRGIISAPSANPTVGIVIDDVPFGSATSFGQGYQAPDVNPLDLAQVEVLRGPQGTLYGADSIGGLLKYVTVAPRMDRVGGTLLAGVNGVEHGAELGYLADGAINIPLSSFAAVRISGFTRQEPGYVDDPALGRKGVNKTNTSGGRIVALLRPSDRLSITLSALLQDSRRKGTANIMPAIGDFDQSFLGGTGQLHSQIQAYSATIKLDLGGAEVTSLSGYNQFKQHGVIDYTPIYGYFTKNGFPGTGFNGFGVSGTPDVIDPIARNYSQEFRLSSPTGRRLEWLAGAFYTHQSARNTAAILAVDETTLQHVGTFWDAKSNTTFDDYAVFADATYHFTGRFSLQLGARQSWIRQTQSEDFEGPFNLVFLGFPEVFVTPKAHDHDQAFTYLVAPTFKFTRNLMAYARFSSGYRAGGLNLAVAPGTPPTFKPDTTQNYELGLKGDLFQHALTIDASAYYIRWKDVQQILLNPAFQGYVDNAGAAKSEGVELAVDAHPVKALTLSGWFAYDNAVLTKGFPASSTAFGQKGDRLPYSSRYSGRLSADLNVPLGERLSGSLGASLSYVGKRIGAFAYGSPVREIYPAYTQIDLRAGLTRDQWELNLFVTNLTDRRGLIGGGIGTLYPNAFQYIRPRAFGASITRSF